MYLNTERINQLNNIEYELCILITQINRQNIYIFRKIITMFEYINNAFIILFQNSNLCCKFNISDVSDECDNSYNIYDSYLKTNHDIIYNTINSKNINEYSLFMNDLVDINHPKLEKYIMLLVNSIYHKKKLSFEEYKQTLQKLMDLINTFDIYDKLINVFNSLYIEAQQLYTLSHKVLSETLQKSEHNITHSIQIIIFEELRKARLLFPEIKTEIEIFTSKLPNIKPHIVSYVEICEKLIEHY